ncbi:hypothetical protein [Streptomyces sp. CMB-StM0423]|uniref:hypothetical protein n=1 Tax=Streptomyces sp. CMB-StM0423 TaxID=2059884 RepID=UPI0018FE92C1|nr:hypothetical protein [Streptomyces sp. CMB-StM0423]
MARPDERLVTGEHRVRGPPGILWVGTPKGTFVALDVDGRHAVEHAVLAGSPVAALGALATGELAVAGGGGELVLVSVRAESGETSGTTGATSRAAVIAFLDATSDLPDDGDPETHLVLSDGTRAWDPDDLAAVTTAAPGDPGWLQLRAAFNSARRDDDGAGDVAAGS